jgi:hypothetical protein
MFKRGLDTRDRSRVILRLLGNLATAEFRLGLSAESELHFKSVLEVCMERCLCAMESA